MKSGKKIQAWSLGVLLVAGLLPAHGEQFRGLRTTDSTGCHMTDGRSTAPTLVAAVELYHDGEFPRERGLQIIDVALSAGCSIDEADDVGSTPLVAAILYNEPELVRLLLQRGADPYRRISSPKPYMNGRDAFGFLALLQEKLPAENRQAVRAELERYRQER